MCGNFWVSCFQPSDQCNDCIYLLWWKLRFVNMRDLYTYRLRIELFLSLSIARPSVLSCPRLINELVDLTVLSNKVVHRSTAGKFFEIAGEPSMGMMYDNEIWIVRLALFQRFDPDWLQPNCNFLFAMDRNP